MARRPSNPRQRRASRVPTSASRATAWPRRPSTTSPPRPACRAPPSTGIFPGGKDEVLRETVGWEMDRFFLRLGEELGDAADFAEFLERALPLARQRAARARGAAEGPRDRARPAERAHHRPAGPPDRGHRRVLPPPARARPGRRAGSPPTSTSPRWPSTSPACPCRSSPRPAATTSAIRTRCGTSFGGSSSEGCC